MTKALSAVVKLDLATNYYYSGCTPNCNLYKLFFKITEKHTNNSVLRKIVRGLEYFFAYLRLLRIIKNNKYDYIHIQWLLMYKLDFIFLKQIKRRNEKIILTAHNALPHVNADKYVKELRKIYAIVDKILVHGKAIEQEMFAVFPELKGKIIIQPHGAVLQRKSMRPDYSVDKLILDRVANKELYIMFGNQFYNKGTDRLLNIWRENYLNDSQKFLVIAGRKTGEYPELEQAKKLLDHCDNVMFLDGYIDDELLEYLILHSEAILLPYRHASMSGVVFTAAEYQTTILTTKCGAIPEYLENGKDSIIVDNSEEGFAAGLKEMMLMTRDERKTFGRCLYENINTKYSWESIAKLLLERVYI